jgi:hypothetical protein
MIILFDAHNDSQVETIRGQISVLFKGKVFKSKACIKITGWRPTGPWKLMWTNSPHQIRGGAPTCRNPNGPVTSPLVWPCHAAIVFNTYPIVWSDHNNMGNFPLLLSLQETAFPDMCLEAGILGGTVLSSMHFEGQGGA